MVWVAHPLPDEVQYRGTEVAARSDLRAQIARLERDLQATLLSSFPHGGVDVALAPRRMAGPRVLALGELEALRDRLAERLHAARAQAAERADRQEEARRTLERMLLDPGRYRFARVANADLGEGGCGVWQVRPRCGLIGMLCGWWQVKLSSGCPLPG
jgi:hypothetical protein